MDDGYSMSSYWDELLQLYSPMIYMIKKKKLDPNGSEIRFIMSEQSKEHQDTTPMINLVKNRRGYLSGQSNLAHRLEEVVETYRKKLQTSPMTTRPISLYIFTDGKWQPGDTPPENDAVASQRLVDYDKTLQDVAKAIKRLVEYLERQGHPEKMAGIQFIQFGNDPIGTERLHWLDEDLKRDWGLARDICDTTPSNDNVWKMLLGSINPYWDADKQQKRTSHLLRET
jgi:hypothetical protein